VKCVDGVLNVCNSTRPTIQNRLIGIAAACLLVSSGTALAALGASPLTGANRHVQSVATSQMRAAAIARAATSPSATSDPAAQAYTVSAVTLDSGTVVREYVATANSVVFAVAWSGPRLPDFREILGTYADRFMEPGLAASGTVTGGVGHRGLKDASVEVESFGRMGKFTGYAYLPAALPAGMSVSDFQ